MMSIFSDLNFSRCFLLPFHKGKKKEIDFFECIMNSFISHLWTVYSAHLKGLDFHFPKGVQGDTIVKKIW